MQNLTEKDIDIIDFFLKNLDRDSFELLFNIKKESVFKDIIIDLFTYSDFFEEKTLRKEPYFNMKLLRLKKILYVFRHCLKNNIDINIKNINDSDRNYIKESKYDLEISLIKNEKILILIDYLDHVKDSISPKELASALDEVVKLNNINKYFIFFSNLFI